MDARHSEKSFVDWNQLLMESRPKLEPRDSICSSSSSLTDSESRPEHPYVELDRKQLKGMDLAQLGRVISDLKKLNDTASFELVSALSKRDKLSDKLVQKFEMVTGVLKSLPLNIKGASTLCFSLTPSGGSEGFRPWLSSWRVVSRTGSGVPSTWRRNLWSALVHYRLSHIDWEGILPGLFCAQLTEEDAESNVGISKDLKSNLTANYASSEDESRLRRVLLAYTRFNPALGYCQGFNILATVILRVTGGDEELCLKILIYLVDHVFPKAFFAHKLEGLSVDITVFRDLMSFYLPELSEHLEGIREAAMKNLQTIRGSNQSSGVDEDDSQLAAYEPPLTNLFTLQWFLTLFATVLPKETALRVWDAIFLDGSEVVFYAALVVWRLFQSDLLVIETSADFYQTMSLLSAHLKKGKIITSNEFMELVYMYIDEVDNCELYSLPSPKELRERYTYSITPLSDQPGVLGAAGPKKSTTPPPRLCPPPSTGASFMASWTLRLPQVRPTTKSQIPQLHIDVHHKKRGKRRSASTSSSQPFVSSPQSPKQGVVMQSAEASMSSEYPQEAMEVEALLYAMAISDNVHKYSFRTTDVLQPGGEGALRNGCGVQPLPSPVHSSPTTPTLPNSRMSPSFFPKGRTVPPSPTTPTFHYPPTQVQGNSPSSPSRKPPVWKQSVSYSSVGELANYLLLQDQR